MNLIIILAVIGILLSVIGYKIYRVFTETIEDENKSEMLGNDN